MNRIATLLYGSVAYGMFLVVLLYAIGFVTGFGVPKTIDSGGGATESAPLAEALVVNGLLMSLFAVQHSVMARQGFKKRWTRFVPRPIERSTFVLATNLVLALLFWQWRPIPGILWEVDGAVGRTALHALALSGWALVTIATFVIDHFDLFGLKQVVLFARQKPYPEPRFQVKFLYRLVRHPLLLGFMIAFWSAPTMTYGRALFAAVTTLYMLFAIQLEERDLVLVHGDAYAEYRKRVPMILPRLGRAPLEAATPLSLPRPSSQEI